MNAKVKGYTLIIMLLGAFALTIYGAYSPARKAQKQQIVCIKYKNGVDPKSVEQQMSDFATLKHEIPQIISYKSGRTIMPNQSTADYDVVHYLTFQSEDDIKQFENSNIYKQFLADNKATWANTLTINADIRQ
jgi:hypothetical protein